MGEGREVEGGREEREGGEDGKEVTHSGKAPLWRDLFEGVSSFEFAGHTWRWE